MEVAAVEIKWFNQSLSKEIESLPKSGPEHLELFLSKYETTLHPTNSHILQVKFALVQFYGNARGFSLTGNLNSASLRWLWKLMFCFFSQKIRTDKWANPQKNWTCGISARGCVDFRARKIQNVGPAAAGTATCVGTGGEKWFWDWKTCQE